MSEPVFIGSQYVAASKYITYVGPGDDYFPGTDDWRTKVVVEAESEDEAKSKLSQAVDEYCERMEQERGGIIYCKGVGQPRIRPKFSFRDWLNNLLDRIYTAPH